MTAAHALSMLLPLTQLDRETVEREVLLGRKKILAFGELGAALYSIQHPSLHLHAIRLQAPMTADLAYLLLLRVARQNGCEKIIGMSRRRGWLRRLRAWGGIVRQIDGGYICEVPCHG